MRRLVLRRGENLSHFVSADRGWRVQEPHAHRNREVRSPDLIGTVDPSADRWRKSETSEFRHSEFSKGEGLGIVNPRSVNSRRDVAAWDPGVRGGPVGPYRESAFRHSGI